MTSYLPPAQSLFSSQQLLQQAVPIGPEPQPGHLSPPYPTRRHFRERLPPTLLMPLNAFPQPSGANESLVGGEEATTSSMPQLVRVVEGRMGEALDGASELLVAPLDCGSVGVPSSQDFFRRLDPVTLWLVAGSAVCGALTLLLFALHIRTITRYIHCPRRRMLYGWMAGVFPVTAVGSLVGAGVPRALPLCDVLIQSYFGLCALFAFAELIQSFLGGELEAPKALRGQAIHLASPPLCCCLPRVLPPLKPSRQNLFRLNALICQAGVVRPLVQFAKGVMWAERMADVTPASTPVLLVLSVVSTMSAMWGLMVLYRLVAPAVPELRPMGLIRLTQILLILFGFQTGAFSLLASPLLGSLVGCDGALPGVSRAALWAHLLLVLEMGLLSAVATLLLRPSRNAVFDLHPCWSVEGCGKGAGAAESTLSSATSTGTMTTASSAALTPPPAYHHAHCA